MHAIRAVGMTTHITQLLRGLCSDGLWRYAVFWSFKSETDGVLTWGDGYVEKMTKDGQMEDFAAGPTVSMNQIISPSCCNESYSFCPIEGALMRMSCHSYPLGEEIIGKVALTGQHCWISANELCSTSMYNYQEEWQLQFAAGIKTVLLVPVIPHGVLQLGAFDMVHESPALVALIKDLFNTFYDDVSVSDTSLATGRSVYSNTLIQTTATLPMDPPYVLPHDLIDSSAQLLTVDRLSLAHAHPFVASEFPILEDVTTGLYRSTSTGRPNAPLDGNGTLAYGDSDGLTLTVTDMAHGYQEHPHGSTIVNDEVVLPNSSMDSEFHKDLEAVSSAEHEFFMLDSMVKHQEPSSHALQVNGSDADFYLQLETSNYAELLLDTIIDQIGHTSNGESSPSADSTFSCEAQIQMEDHALRLDESSVPGLLGGQELPPVSMNEGFMGCAMTDSWPTEINEIMTDEGGIEDAVQNTHRVNSAEIKRRCRKADLQRPRPRDRQLIQDRMKGLRELIPNASKFSIDALLDKTIGYMLFLRSVSDKAEEIKNALESRDENKKQLESCPLRVEELHHPGHLLIEMLCEDYELFLEMAHAFKGLGVSILKGVLEHTSASASARSDSDVPAAAGLGVGARLWARFVIQAPKGFNQMQILCPLMHLLRRR